MEKDNTLLIIEESDNDEKTQEEPAAKLKLAMANKKLKEDFLKKSVNKPTTEIMDEDFENDIDRSMQEMEETVGLTYDSESDGEPASSHEKFRKRHKHSKSSPNSSDSEDEGAVHSAKNSQLIESSVLQRRIQDEYQPVLSIMMPFYERRRLSECKEESETDEEIETPVKPAIVVMPTNGEPPKKRFIVTKTKVEPVDESTVKPPVSILKKTPSPPSNLKKLTHSPKKIRYEAEVLKNVSARNNSQTIHFPCTSAMLERANVKSFFSPQRFLNPHLDKRFFDTSLVEVRASQTLNDSSKSLDSKGNKQLDDNVWIKRPEADSTDKTNSSDSIDNKNRNVGESVSPLKLKLVPPLIWTSRYLNTWGCLLTFRLYIGRPWRKFLVGSTTERSLPAVQKVKEVR